MDQIGYKTVMEDSDGQLFLNFTTAELNQMGWDIGDELLWEINDDQTATITKKD